MEPAVNFVGLDKNVQFFMFGDLSILIILRRYIIYSIYIISL